MKEIEQEFEKDVMILYAKYINQLDRSMLCSRFIGVGAMTALRSSPNTDKAVAFIEGVLLQTAEAYKGLSNEH